MATHNQMLSPCQVLIIAASLLVSTLVLSSCAQLATVDKEHALRASRDVVASIAGAKVVLEREAELLAILSSFDYTDEERDLMHEAHVAAKLFFDDVAAVRDLNFAPDIAFKYETMLAGYELAVSIIRNKSTDLAALTPAQRRLLIDTHRRMEAVFAAMDRLRLQAADETANNAWLGALRDVAELGRLVLPLVI